MNSDIQNLNQYSEKTFTDYSKVQLPSIMRRQKGLTDAESSKGFSNSSGMRSTKTFLQKKEDKILDISNLVEAASANLEPDSLLIKYEKIKKLRDEFNDIKVQFNIPEPKYIDPSQMNNSSLLSYKRGDLKSRGSEANTTVTSHLQNNDSTAATTTHPSFLQSRKSANSTAYQADSISKGARKQTGSQS